MADGARLKNKYKFADIQVQFESEAAKVCKAFMAKFPLTQKQTRLLLNETRAKKFNFNPELESEDQEEIEKNEKNQVLQDFKFERKYILRSLRDHKIDGTT